MPKGSDHPDASYPQTNQEKGVHPPKYNPYERRTHQIRLANQFLADAPSEYALIVVPLDVPAADVRCSAFDAMQRLVCQAHTEYLVYADADKDNMVAVPTCAAHLGKAVAWARILNQAAGMEKMPDE